MRVVIDYAHTPDGLENVLKATREITDGKLFSVFGCGGNRDKTKRPIMGKISQDMADYTIITTDNPRYEDPLNIAASIATGFSKSNFEVELDRKKAIEKAISMAVAGDSVVVAGKGCEDYMEINGVKHHFQDAEVIENFLQDKED